MLTPFLHWEVLGTPRAIFQHYHLGVFISLAMEKPVYFLFLAVYLIPDKLEGGVSKRKYWDFFILLNEHRLNQEVFINIEQFKELCGINILGQTIVTILVCIHAIHNMRTN